MSICPNKDILSMYIDNELTPTLKRDFESHLHTCGACTQQVSHYSSLRNSLQFVKDDFDLEEGYKRLQARKSYKAHLAPYGSARDPSLMFRLTPVFVAAAALAIFFPLFTNNAGSTQDSAPLDIITPIGNMDSVHARQIAPIQEKGVVLDDAIAMSYIDTNKTYQHSITLDATKLTEFDVFKPESIKDNTPIDIILFDSPAIVLHETDRFGFSQPVFLLRE